MRTVVVVLVGLAVVVLGVTWTLTADDDSAVDRPGSMMSTGVPGGTDDGLGMMPGAPGPGGGTGIGMGSGMMDVDSEADYLVAMVPHHEEAIDAAEELARSDRAEMRELGETVVASQTAQVEQMESWLERLAPRHQGPRPTTSR